MKKQNLFDNAVLKLTLVYTAILAIICIGFSAVFFTAANQELNRPITVFGNNDTLHIGGNPIFENPEFQAFINARNNEMRANLLFTLFLLNVGILALGACASYFLARHTLRPIQKMTDQQANFISDASHELRTPLTAITMENEVALRDTSLPKAQLINIIRSNLEETKKLQKLTDTLLQLSSPERIDPKDREVVIEQIINIFIDNAKKHGGKNVKVKVIRDKNIIKVIDDGPGIAQQDMPHIFDRFYRADKSRTTKGYGLGLPLAKQLAERLNLKITVQNNKTKGVTFSLSPLA